LRQHVGDGIAPPRHFRIAKSPVSDLVNGAQMRRQIEACMMRLRAHGGSLGG
jgi:hypothetical protein